MTSPPTADHIRSYPPSGISPDHANGYSSPSQPSQSKRPLAAQSQAARVVVHHASDGGVRIAGGPDEAPPTILELPPMYSSYIHTAP